jgi:hypothetical protein
MKNLILTMILMATTWSCIPDNLKEQMQEELIQGTKMLADQEFKKAIGQIELHKLRNGSYPSSLSELRFLTAMDSSIFNYADYRKIDSVYELNLKMELPSLDGKKKETVEIHYPAEFWKGLGCVKSNVK